MWCRGAGHQVQRSFKPRDARKQLGTQADLFHESAFELAQAQPGTVGQRRNAPATFPNNQVRRRRHPCGQRMSHSAKCRQAAAQTEDVSVERTGSKCSTPMLDGKNRGGIVKIRHGTPWDRHSPDRPRDSLDEDRGRDMHSILIHYRPIREPVRISWNSSLRSSSRGPSSQRPFQALVW